jgi:transposase
MARSGPRKVFRYSLDFKLAAVRLSNTPDVQVRTVASALEIHPFMLSKWRREWREGSLRGPNRPTPAPPPARELRRLATLERDHAMLREEHALLKKAIRFCSARPRTPSRSSRANPRRSA